MAADLKAAAEAWMKSIDEAELGHTLGGEHDAANVILSINAGAGGTESQDWAEMLFRMYLRFCERRGFKVDVTDFQKGEEAGIKSVTMFVSGEYAFGTLAVESGVHRLVRISPFDSAARRHTSFAAVFAWPELDDSIEIEILDKDIRVDTNSVRRVDVQLTVATATETLEVMATCLLYTSPSPRD